MSVFAHRYLIYLFLCIVGYLIFKFLLKPYYYIRYYQKQGFNLLFNPVGGEFLTFKKLAIEHGDSLYRVKQLIKEDPNFKGTVTFISDRCELILANPDQIRDVTQNEIINFRRYGHFFNLQKMLAPYGLALVDGDFHKRTRKILTSCFHFDFLADSIPTMTTLANEKFKEWEEKGYVGKNQYFDIEVEASSFTGEVIGYLFFGIAHSHFRFQGKKLTEVVMSLPKIFGPLIPYVLLMPMWMIRLLPFAPFKKVSALIKGLRGTLTEIFNQRKKEFLENQKNAADQKGKKDLMAVLLESQSENLPIEERLTDEEIYSQYAIFVGAGTNTTSHLIMICLYLLTQYPEYISQIRDEIKSFVPDINNIKYDQLVKLEVLNGVIKEALRLYDPLQTALPKEVTVTHNIKGLTLLKGTIVSFYLGANSMKEKYFHEPEKFLPERWIGKDAEGNKLQEPFAYIPFSAGPRHCIGQHLAQIEAKVFLALVVAKYTPKIQPGYKLAMVVRFLYEPLEPPLMSFDKVSNV